MTNVMFILIRQKSDSVLRICLQRFFMVSPFLSYAGNCCLIISMWSTFISLTPTLLWLCGAILFQSGKVLPSLNHNIPKMKPYSMCVTFTGSPSRNMGTITPSPLIVRLINLFWFVGCTGVAIARKCCWVFFT